MIHLSLMGLSERLDTDPTFFPAEFGRARPALYAQRATYEALVDGANIVLNCYPTGSGKTKAALLYLHRLAANPLDRANCLFIAPTNELLRQHANDIAAFCERNALPHQVILLTREHMDAYVQEIDDVARGLPRRASKLVALLRDPRLILRDAEGNTTSDRHPYVLVTNPDLFYTAVFCRYGPNEVRPLLKQFLAGFQYLVVDEFHYYNPKQLANFLFFLAVWRHYGFFEEKGYPAKVCLLSATPGEHVRTYLSGLDVRVDVIDPDTEPDGAQAPRIPSLAPVELDLRAPEVAGDGGLVNVVRSRLSDVRRWLDQQQQGAIISGALWRINLINQTLGPFLGERVARLTGAESRDARARATRADIILATPTVDLGYNFDRPEKPRQALDFGLFDAAFADEFVQRLGRVGRVLGKPETNVPSYAVAVVPDKVLDALRRLEGREVSRAELREALRARAAELPNRNDLFEYIATGAIDEAFLPIFRLKDMSDSASLDDIKALFQRVRDLYRAPEHRTFERLTTKTRHYVQFESIFRNAPTAPDELVRHVLSMPNDAGLRAWLRDYALAKAGKAGEPPAERLAAIKVEASKPESPTHRKLRDWAVSSYKHFAVSAASFSFRESFEPPQACVLDPHHLLSSADVAGYDAFHIIQNYHAEFFTAETWHERTRLHPTTGASEESILYCELRKLREPGERLRLRFELACNEERAAWEDRHVCQMTALSELEVRSDTGQLNGQVIDSLKARYIPAFLAPLATPIGGMLAALARARGGRQFDLEVRFASGSPRQYRAVFGTFALLAATQLRCMCAAYRQRQGKDYSEPIWC